jgi:mono/diheme cytochrome c family protein
MRTLFRLIVSLAALAILAALAAIGYARSTGLKGLPAPGPVETRVARTIRSFAIPAADRARRMPAGQTQESLYLGMEHYAKYCALCHANNGGGGEKTPLGNGLYPKPTDLRAAPTQELTDGELFYIIDNGVRFTGMPAFGIGRSTPAGDKQLWELVQFVRHLPSLTADEVGQMEGLNPL